MLNEAVVNRGISYTHVLCFVDAFKEKFKDLGETVAAYTNEAKSLNNELSNIESLPNTRLEEIRSFFIELSKQYGRRDKPVRDL